ncbi:MAG: penicillin-binding protein 2 [Terriglobia bacterium]
MEARFPEEPHLPSWKIPFLQGFIAIILVGLLAGYWRLQITDHRQYVEASERNRIRDLPIIAPRGRILDRNGRVLVDDLPAFSVLFSRDGPRKITPVMIAGIAKGLNLDPVSLEDEFAGVAHLPRFQPVVIKKSADMQDVAFVESHRIEYPELDLIQVQQRFYPKHEVAASVLGYVGDVSPETIAKTGSRYQPGDVVGKSGIEKEYNSILSGVDGMRRVVVNSRGQEVGAMTATLPRAGRDLRLTLDLDLQLAAEQALGNRAGAVVAMDPRSGEILAMVSHPDFDPNDFTRGIARQEWQQLVKNPQRPLMNKAIQAQLAPGSVFKLVTATAALETGTIRPNFTVYCPGYVNFYGHTYHDWSWVHHRGHGEVNLHRAITISCDVYFYTIGKMVGIDKIAYFAKHLGLGSRTGIDLPGEEPGLIPTPAWVEKDFHHKWYPGETISVAIGQGAVVVTPLQLAYMVAGLASGGIFHRPHLAFENELTRLGIDPPAAKPEHLPLSSSTLQAVCSGMWGVVNEGGTGAAARVPGLQIAGKTGTAQVVSVALKHSAHAADYRNNAWFVGYAPFDNPQIVVSALVMHGGESSVAAPIAGQVIKAYFGEENAQPAPTGNSSRQPEVAINNQRSSPSGP